MTVHNDAVITSHYDTDSSCCQNCFDMCQWFPWGKCFSQRYTNCDFTYSPQILRSQEADNNDIVDLAQDLHDFIQVTFGVRQLDTPYVRTAIAEMGKLFKGVNELIVNRENRRNLGSYHISCYARQPSN